ncbi:MAG: alpha-E domain-containing protein, partial [Acidobacteria bacterium]|nr:alpha-E domain-containing protein [Acidobacteriota bacterium]
MLSRVADSLYWMARYLERAEHTARIVGVQLNLILDQTKLTPEDRWKRILESLGIETEKLPAVDTGSLTRTLLYDPDFPSSIVSSMQNARENCRQVRNQISSEMWEQLNRLY